jgi:hypothetical protein
MSKRLHFLRFTESKNSAKIFGNNKKIEKFSCQEKVENNVEDNIEGLARVYFEQ